MSYVRRNSLPLRIAALAAAIVLASCGLTSSPAEGLSFKPPAGWQSSPGIMGFMQFWKPPNDSKQVVLLIRSPKPLDQKEVFTNANLKDATVTEQRDVTICGNQRAVEVQGEGDSSQGGRSHIWMVFTNAGGNAYFALYVYKVGSPPNRDAIAAIHQLCLAKT